MGSPFCKMRPLIIILSGFVTLGMSQLSNKGCPQIQLTGVTSEEKRIFEGNYTRQNVCNEHYFYTHNTMSNLYLSFVLKEHSDGWEGWTFSKAKCEARTFRYISARGEYTFPYDASNWQEGFFGGPDARIGVTCIGPVTIQTAVESTQTPLSVTPTLATSSTDGNNYATTAQLATSSTDGNNYATTAQLATSSTDGNNYVSTDEQTDPFQLHTNADGTPIYSVPPRSKELEVRDPLYLSIGAVATSLVAIIIVVIIAIRCMHKPGRMSKTSETCSCSSGLAAGQVDASAANMDNSGRGNIIDYRFLNLESQHARLSTASSDFNQSNMYSFTRKQPDVIPAPIAVHIPTVPALLSKNLPSNSSKPRMPKYKVRQHPNKINKPGDKRPNPSLSYELASVSFPNYEDIDSDFPNGNIAAKSSMLCENTGSSQSMTRQQKVRDNYESVVMVENLNYEDVEPHDGFSIGDTDVGNAYEEISI